MGQRLRVRECALYMLLRSKWEMRQKLIESVDALKDLVEELRAALARREAELAAREAEQSRAAGALAERQRHLEALALEVEKQQIELQALVREVAMERDALRVREQALAEREAVRLLRRASGRAVPRVLTQPVMRTAAAPEDPGDGEGAAREEERAGTMPAAAGGEDRAAAPGTESILVRIIGPAGEVQTVPAQVRFGEGSL